MYKLGRAWARLFPNPRYYGWAVVGAGFLCSALSAPGQSFVISLYLEHLIRDLGISRVELSSLYAAATLLAAACLPMLGGWSDGLSGRRFLAPVLAMLGLAMLLLARVESVLTLAAAFFLVRLLGQGAIGLGTLTVTVRWFRRYRGRALALVTLGYPFGEMVFPASIYALIAMFGWRGSLVALAGLYLLVFAPFVALLLRERAAGEELDGEPAAAVAVRRAAAQPLEPSLSLREALRTPVFWGLLFCVSVPPLVLTALIFHQVALFSSQGWSTLLIAPAFTAFAIGSVTMTYTAGLLLERVPSRYGISVSMALAVLGFASVSLPISGVAGAFLYGTLLGLAAGAAGATNSVVWPDYFGIDALGAIKGVVNAVRNGASALGPPVAAVLITSGGSFARVLLLFGAIAALAGVVALVLAPPAAASAYSPSGAGEPASDLR
jgi:sugar phosphate permease